MDSGVRRNDERGMGEDMKPVWLEGDHPHPSLPPSREKGKKGMGGAPTRDASAGIGECLGGRASTRDARTGDWGG